MSKGRLGDFVIKSSEYVLDNMTDRAANYMVALTVKTFRKYSNSMTNNYF